MKTTRLVTILSGLALLVVASGAHATNYSLWVHGYSPLRLIPVGNYGDFSYFGPASRAAGVNKRAVNWDGQHYVSETNVYVRDALDCYCTGPNWCYIATHSTGDMQVAYALDLYGGSTRNIKAPDTGDANGRCQNASGGGTQTGWNIYWIDGSGGAAGGSELAPIGHWVDKNTTELIGLNQTVLVDLDPVRARSSTFFNHNQTRGKWFYMFAGAKGVIATSGILPGQDDQVIAYHSAGAVSGDAEAWCNPVWAGDVLCYGELTPGTSDAAGWWFNPSVRKWTHHTVQFRDTWETKMHLPWVTAVGAQDWGEIIGVEREDMVTYAR